jgi:hypothetical protein
MHAPSSCNRIMSTNNQAESSAPHRGPRRSQRQRAPRVQNGDRPQTEVSDIVQNGVVSFKISSATPRSAYCQLARLFCAGFDNHGQPLESQYKVHSVQLTALGGAIETAIFVADNLVKGGACDYAETEVEYLQEDNDVSRRPGPRIRLLLKLNRKWDSTKDEELGRSKIYQKNVLKNNVD